MVMEVLKNHVLQIANAIMADTLQAFENIKQVIVDKGPTIGYRIGFAQKVAGVS